MTPISLIVPIHIMKANYSEILMLNIDYYIQKIFTVNSKQIFGQLFLNTNNGKTNINPKIQLFV